MATYFNVVLNKPDEMIRFIMQDYLQKNNFEFIQKDHESFWRGGEPFFSGYKYLNWSYYNGELTIDAWVTDIASSKRDLTANTTGVFFKKDLEKLIEYLKTASVPPISPVGSPQNINSVAPSQQLITPQPQQTLPPPADPRQAAANTSLALGITALVLSFFVSIVAFFLGIAAMVQANKCKDSPYSQQAKPGSICAIIAVVICIVKPAIATVLYIFLYMIFA